MTDNHPITPPPELFRQWEDDILNERDNVDHVLDCAWRHGFHAGADQELEECCKALARELICCDGKHVATDLRDVRRPKPPSLAKQAMEAQQRVWNNGSTHADWEVIRRALERLQELENND